ncbi:MAG: DUF1064 domain-containing protein [Betaproteobacteria bacterium]
MADVTERVSASQYRSMLCTGAPVVGPRRPGHMKYGNRKTAAAEGEAFDSAKEARTAAGLEMAKRAVEPTLRVVLVERQKWFLVIPKQEGERSASYIADFVVTYADGHVEVIDTKSFITRKLPTYVLKRKLMLQVHGIRIRED